MTDSSDDKERLQYIKADLLQDKSPIRRPPWMQAGLDDDSNLFMSEPSISEADESSEQHMRLLSPFGSFTEDEDDNDGLPPPPPPPARLLAPPSPGNTSLSSWESPHPNRRIHLHFSPGGDSLSQKAESIASHPHYQRNYTHQSSSPTPPYPTSDPYLSSGLLPPTAGGVKTPDRSFVNSSNSTSPISEGQQHQLETFFDNLRVKSEGQMQESAGANASLDSLNYTGRPGGPGPSTFDFSAIMRSGVMTKRPHSVPMENAGITSNRNDDDDDAGVMDSKSVDGNGANDTVVMVLSDDSADEITGKGEEIAERVENEVKASADDEKATNLRQYRAMRNTKSFGGSGGRNGNASGGRGHRRQRSGDAAAATLSTGSKEWRGMEHDKIPLPPVPGGDDEDDYDDDDQEKSSNVNVRGDRPRSIDIINKATGERSMEPSSNSNFFRSTIDEGEGFSLGIGGGHESQQISTRTRPRRESYRGRKLAGLSIDSEDSSSLTSSGRIVGATRRARNAPLPSSAFHGHTTSPDWSAPSSPNQRHGYHQLHYPPPPDHAGTPYSLDDMEHGNWLGYARGPEQPTPGVHQAPLYSSSAELGFRSLSFSPRMTSGHSSIGIIDNSFSWLSDRRDTMESQASFQGSESSPLIVSGTRNYDGRRRDDMPDSDSYRGQEFEPTDQSAKARPKVVLNPILQEGRKAFEAASFSTIGNRFGKADRRSFLPESDLDHDEKYQTFVCPVCQTRQREFFTVTNAPRQFESASGYIAFYFGIYVIASLYIFGLQEGWGKLDCIYFAVITLTTAGLGDFVPTTDGAKVVCSIFIYFGVACIGLLLGSYIAGMLDESSRRAAQENRIKSCPNCIRIQNIREASERRRKQYKKEYKQFHRHGEASHTGKVPTDSEHDAKRVKRSSTMETFDDVTQSERGATTQPVRFRNSRYNEVQSNNPKIAVETTSQEYPSSQGMAFSAPSAAEMLKRQSHSRHESMDFGNQNFVGLGGEIKAVQYRKFSADMGMLQTAVQEAATTFAHPSPSQVQYSNAFNNIVRETEDDNSSTCSSESFSSSCESLDLEDRFDGVKNARYVFLTLREALVNSLVIIGTGCFGFYFIEGFSFIDSWYFTTVLLTTVGYGDLVPYTRGGKLFATVYILVAGTILLNNMSMISMIPLELRRRRTERAVLTQFGDSLDDSALRELATGPLIQRLNLATEHALDECTREMFCLAMLVRLGKVSEEDIKLTFAAFKKLDVHDEGVLNSRAVIAGMIQKRRGKPARNAATDMRSNSASPFFGSNLFVPAQPATNQFTVNDTDHTYGATLSPDDRSGQATSHADLNHTVFWGTSSFSHHQTPA